MSQHARAPILAAAASFICLFTLQAQAPPATLHPFNGGSLAGWHTVGTGSWRAENSAIAGSAKGGSGGWLVLDKNYEDTILRFAFQCSSCEGGVLLRNAPIDGGRT